MPPGTVEAGAENKLNRRGQQALQPGWQHHRHGQLVQYRLWERAQQHRQHQRQRQGHADAHRCKTGPGRSRGGLHHGVGRAGLITGVANGSA